jgi:hypothetical protein
MLEKKIQVCVWVGEGEGCRHPSIYGKAYCERHHNRMYTSFFTEMADYIIEQELNSAGNNAK